MTGSTQEQPALGSRMTRFAGVAGLAAPVIWAALAAVEVAHANIGHSIISRPERFFSDPSWHWPVVALVVAAVAAQLVAGLAVLASWPGRGRSAAGAAGALLGVAGMARLVMALLLPSDPHGYSISFQAAIAGHVVLIALPIGLVLAAVAIARRSAGLAWFTAAIAIAMAWIAIWAATWAARSGASEPQLLAIEPVEALASIRAAAVGAWLLGWPARMQSGARWPRILAPGRKSAAALAVVAVVGIVAAAGPFVQAYRTVIEAQLTLSTKVETIHADGVDRTYRVHRPVGDGFSSGSGLVIVLHGSFGGGFQIEANSGFDAQADRLGWIAVYPDGVADGWDAFGSNARWGKHPGADDVAFISALIDHFQATDGINTDRVYVTGMSRGGMMTYRLGCELSDRIAAIAVVSGNMATESGSADVPCALAHPVSVLAIHGTADGTIPINGGKVDINFSPMADVIAKWRSWDGCADPSTSSVDGPSTTTTWACSGGSAVSTRIVTGGWHVWPNVSGTLASDGGSPDSFNAASLIADFFAAHPRAAGGD